MKRYVLLTIIFIETAIIFFFIAGIIFHPKEFKEMPDHEFSVDTVAANLNLNAKQKEEYIKIYNNFESKMKVNRKIERENMREISRLVASPTSNKKHVLDYTKKHEKDFSVGFINGTEYLLDLKSILNDNQKKEFEKIIKNKHEMYKIMPAPRGRNKR